MYKPHQIFHCFSCNKSWFHETILFIYFEFSDEVWVSFIDFSPFGSGGREGMVLEHVFLNQRDQLWNIWRVQGALFLSGRLHVWAPFSWRCSFTPFCAGSSSPTLIHATRKQSWLGVGQFPGSIQVDIPIAQAECVSAFLCWLWFPFLIILARIVLALWWFWQTRESFFLKLRYW